MKCTQPFCTGTIVDGYCDVCGMAPTVVPAAAPAARAGDQPPAAARSVGRPGGSRPGEPEPGQRRRR